MVKQLFTLLIAGGLSLAGCTEPSVEDGPAPHTTNKPAIDEEMEDDSMPAEPQPGEEAPAEPQAGEKAPADQQLFDDQSAPADPTAE